MKLNTTHLQVLYLDGHLRYIHCGDEEIVRMIFSALRNSRWYTIPMTISDEKIVQHPNSFSIEYKAHYVLDDINYEARIKITGDEDDTILFDYVGIAQSDFLSNRIGICVHHPIKECMGQPVTITQPDHKLVHASFPRLVDPNVVFKNIRKFSWKTPLGNEALLEFEGDIFESEDQRNWSDNSYKTYSTPVELPFPVAIKQGDLVKQTVKLYLQHPAKGSEPGVELSKPEIRYAFPRLGYARNSQLLTEEHIQALQPLLFDHYRVEIDFAPGWQESLKAAQHEAKLLNTRLELAVLFDDYIREYDELKNHLYATVSSMIVLQKNKSIPDAKLLDHIMTNMKNEFPLIKAGSGTQGHFVDLNRNRAIDDGIDFIAYSVTPQAHLTDDLIIIENLEAQQYAIETLRTFSHKPIHITPLTLKSRDYPTLTIDHRQHTDRIAQWTALCFKYLAGVEQITLFETIGPKGIISEEGPSPVYEMLKQIAAFRPKYIIKIAVDHPLAQDSLVLENESGDRMSLDISF